MTLEQLHTFVAVARREHITRTAEAIHLSQGAVSEQVRLLERSLGIQLLERVGRRVKVTAAGREIERAAAVALIAVRELEQLAAQRRGLSGGTLIVAASSTTGVHRLPEWLAGFLAARPGIEIRLRLANTAIVVAALRAGEVDLAVVEGPFTATGLAVLDLDRDELLAVVAAGHPLARLRRVGVAALAAHRYLAREAGSGTEALAAQVLGAAYGRSPTLELGQAAAIRSGVLSGLGYAVISRAIVADDIAAGLIVVLPRPPLSRQFQALRRLTSLSPVLDAFWAHLSTVVAPGAAGLSQ
ncbi:MAG: LysR family transcriptional regulator [Candidatus Dormibacteria bacterium]